MNIAIYMEGGGQERGSKAALRQGMDTFLADIKNACRNKRWGWKLVPCGGRKEAHKRFQNERRNNDADIIVLLVDSETKVVKEPAAHLTAWDKWNFHGTDGDMIHLMAQTMETWIVADPEALRAYYGQGFLPNALPRHQNLEEVSKPEIKKSLDNATKGAQNKEKKKYHKIRHARELLQKIDPMKVRERCPHCERLFEILLGRMDSGV